jgi:hypothetical protein
MRACSIRADHLATLTCRPNMSAVGAAFVLGGLGGFARDYLSTWHDENAD